MISNKCIQNLDFRLYADATVIQFYAKWVEEQSNMLLNNNRIIIFSKNFYSELEWDSQRTIDKFIGYLDKQNLTVLDYTKMFFIFEKGPEEWCLVEYVPIIARFVIYVPFRPKDVGRALKESVNFKLRSFI